jgi:hypothetical protein
MRTCSYDALPRRFCRRNNQNIVRKSAAFFAGTQTKYVATASCRLLALAGRAPDWRGGLGGAGPVNKGVIKGRTGGEESMVNIHTE